MDWPQLITGSLLVVVLLGLALFYGVRQLRLLRKLREDPEHGPEESQFQARQARRRLITSTLLLLLGLLLLGALLFLEAPAQRLADERDAQPEGETIPLTAEQKSFARFYGWYWVVVLTLLLSVVILAAIDFWATRRYARAAHKKIREDRRAMLERQVSRMRQEGNGHV